MRPTAKEVAHRAGVSLSAVSRAFTPGSPLDPAKRQFILQTAVELGYASPAHRAAEAIAAGTVSLVTGDLMNPFYPAIVERLSRRLQETRRQLLVYALPENATVDVAIDPIVAARPKAVIVTSAHLTSRMAAACRRNGIRMILLNRIQRDLRIDAVACDNYQGGRDAADYLLGAGRQRLGYIAGVEATSTQADRERGFVNRLAERGRVLFGREAGAFRYDVAYDAAVAILSQKPAPDALFCCNDVMALAVIDAARNLRLKVPQDLAVVGFDDIPMASWAPYQLTTMRQPISRMVDEAIRLVTEPTGGHGEDGAIRTFPGQLIIRTSA